MNEKNALLFSSLEKKKYMFAFSGEHSYEGQKHKAFLLWSGLKRLPGGVDLD